MDDFPGDRRKNSIDPDLIWIELRDIRKKVDSLAVKVYIMFGAFTAIGIALEIASRSH